MKPSQMIDVYNYYHPALLPAQRRNGLLEAIIWESSDDIPKCLRIYASDRFMATEDSRPHSTFFLELKGGEKRVTTSIAYAIIFNPKTMDESLKRFMLDYVESRDIVRLGLVIERLLEIDMPLAHTMFSSWYQQANYIIKRPQIKSHNLKLYIPVGDSCNVES